MIWPYTIHRVRPYTVHRVWSDHILIRVPPDRNKGPIEETEPILFRSEGDPPEAIPIDSVSGGSTTDRNNTGLITD